MLWRAEVRTTAVSLLTAALNTAGATVVSDKDEPQTDDTMPGVTVHVDDKKTFDYGSAPQAKTHARVTIDVYASGNSKDEAVAQLDTLCGLVEDTLFGTPAFVSLFEMIDSCDSFTEVNGDEGAKHFAHCTIEIVGHTSEVWQPAITDDLSGISFFVSGIAPPSFAPKAVIGAAVDMPTD
jgi:hypothetical protein